MAAPLPIRMSAREAVQFWERVDRYGSGCWDWTGTRFTEGYGRLTLGGHCPDRIYRAHRVAWALAYDDDLADGSLVMQTCDNRLCCRPDHLQRGECLDMAALRVQRGRSTGPKGHSHPDSRLTAEQVAEIRALDIAITRRRGGSSLNETHRALGRKYGVHPSTIEDIRNRKTWRWLAPIEKGSAASRRAGFLPEPLAADESPAREDWPSRVSTPVRGDL